MQLRNTGRNVLAVDDALPRTVQGDRIREEVVAGMAASGLGFKQKARLTCEDPSLGFRVY